MSEGKRIKLTSIGPKKAKVTQKETKCIRFDLPLTESNKKWCPIFDYEALIKAEKEKLEREQRQKSELNGGAGQAGAKLDGDDEDLKAMAKHFEDKYGDRRYTYAELGAGYDESDSFIDNTEICEEQLIDDAFKKYQGYYINKEKFDSNSSSERRSSDDTKRKRKARITFTESEESESESSSSSSSKDLEEEKSEEKKLVPCRIVKSVVNGKKTEVDTTETEESMDQT